MLEVASVLIARYGERIGRCRTYALLLVVMAIAGSTLALTTILPLLILAELGPSPTTRLGRHNSARTCRKRVGHRTTAPAFECFDGAGWDFQFSDHGRRFRAWVLLGTKANADVEAVHAGPDYHIACVDEHDREVCQRRD